MGWLWSLVTILGPLLLIAAIVWATLRVRNASRSSYERAEQSARDVRQDISTDEEKDLR